LQTKSKIKSSGFNKEMKKLIHQINCAKMARLLAQQTDSLKREVIWKLFKEL
jgi:hypothetical protein